jgi:hypothetical protein
MAAALRVDKAHGRSAASEISPTSELHPASIPPNHPSFRPKRCKSQ